MGLMFPDISRALRKCQYSLGDDEECRNVFAKGSLRVSYRRSGNNFEQLLAPSKIVLSEEK